MKAMSCLIAALVVVLLLTGVSNTMAGAYDTGEERSGIANVKRYGQVVGSHWMVRFDIQWENSWRNDIAGAGQAEPYNWDAAWVFVKYRTNTTGSAWGNWQHASLSTNASDHVAPAGSTISVGLSATTNGAGQTITNGVGVFVYRSANGSGTFTANKVRLRWNHATNGVADNANIELKMCAIEMVYVSTGAFYVGSGRAGDNHFHVGGSAATPFWVTNEYYEIQVGDDDIGKLYYTSNSAYCGDGGGPLSNAFPKGFSAFYGMKHEITQAQYVDFLNMLTRSQQYTSTSINRFSSTTVSNFMGGSASYTNPVARNGVQLISDEGGAPNPRVYANNLDMSNPPNSTNDGQWIACNWMSWADSAAYLDWAGLRPMTEFEFEKACRGTNIPIAWEFAWGTANITNVTLVINKGTANEAPTNADVNCIYTGTSVGGPVRVGCFGMGVGTRPATGAGYYGMMELSGNVFERPVTVGTPEGRIFTGQHGDGVLNGAGNADVAFWPAISGLRGGRWDGSSGETRVAARDYAAWLTSDRYNYLGGRGVRSAP